MMIIRYTGSFLRKLKKSDVRIRKAFKRQLLIFTKNPNNLELDNHDLRDEWLGHRSINITPDWRAIYRQIKESEEIAVYFVALGTHEELYQKS